MNACKGKGKSIHSEPPNRDNTRLHPHSAGTRFGGSQRNIQRSQEGLQSCSTVLALALL